MFQLHLTDQQLYCLLRCNLYYKFDSNTWQWRTGYSLDILYSNSRNSGQVIKFWTSKHYVALVKWRSVLKDLDRTLIQHVEVYKNPLHLDVVNWYLRRMGDKTIPDEAPPSLESFYTTIKVLWILCLIHQWTPTKVYFKVKTQERRRFVGCLTIVIQIRKWHLIACIVMVTPWRLFAMQINTCHPLRLKPFGYVQKYQTHLYICRSVTSLCQGFFIVCVYMHINPDKL